MDLTRWDQDQERIRAICARLTREGVVEPPDGGARHGYIPGRRGNSLPAAPAR